MMRLPSRRRGATTPATAPEAENPPPPHPAVSPAFTTEIEQLNRALNSLCGTVETRSTTPITARLTLTDPESGATRDIPLTRRQTERITNVVAEFANDYHQAAAEDLEDRLEQHRRVQADEWDDPPF